MVAIAAVISLWALDKLEAPPWLGFLTAGLLLLVAFIWPGIIKTRPRQLVGAAAFLGYALFVGWMLWVPGPLAIEIETDAEGVTLRNPSSDAIGGPILELSARLWNQDRGAYVEHPRGMRPVPPIRLPDPDALFPAIVYRVALPTPASLVTEPGRWQMEFTFIATRYTTSYHRFCFDSSAVGGWTDTVPC
jgi:hypothetical protein